MKTFLILLLIMTAGCSDMSVQQIAPSKIKQSDLILDVRTEEEHKEVSLMQPHWIIPLAQLNAKKFIQEKKLDGSKTLYILCRSGKRAEIAAKKIRQAGFKNIAIIQGGIIAAEKSGIPVKKKEQKTF